MGFVSIAYVRSLHDYLSERDHDLEAIFGRAMMRRLETADSRTRIPALQWSSMFDKAIRATGDPHLALHVGEAVKVSHYGMLGYMTLSCGTLAEAIERLARYERLVGEPSRSILSENDGFAELRWRSPFSPRPPAPLAETALAAWTAFGRWMLGGQRLEVEAACFQHPAPADIREHERIFGGRVLFGQDHSALLFRRDYLEMPLPRRTLEPRQGAERPTLRRVRDLPPESFDRRLDYALRVAVERGRPRLEEVAADLGMHPRTLQRSLKAHGDSFQARLDQVRRDIAQELLREGRLNLLEIALILGFSEQSAFQRAFKRWTGMTPGRWRELDSERPGLRVQ